MQKLEILMKINFFKREYEVNSSVKTNFIGNYLPIKNKIKVKITIYAIYFKH